MFLNRNPLHILICMIIARRVTLILLGELICTVLIRLLLRQNVNMSILTRLVHEKFTEFVIFRFFLRFYFLFPFLFVCLFGGGVFKFSNANSLFSSLNSTILVFDFFCEAYWYIPLIYNIRRKALFMLHVTLVFYSTEHDTMNVKSFTNEFCM